jgi:hypothetical protein
MDVIKRRVTVFGLPHPRMWVEGTKEELELWRKGLEERLRAGISVKLAEEATLVPHDQRHGE